MAKAPKKSTPEVKTAEPDRQPDAAAKERLAAEREQIYQDHKAAIDKALHRCVSHFTGSAPHETIIVAAVGRMLFDYYLKNRMKSTKVDSLTLQPVRRPRRSQQPPPT